MTSNAYRFEIAEIGDAQWTIGAVHMDGGEVVELVGLYASREAAEVNLPRIAREWSDTEKRKGGLRAV